VYIPRPILFFLATLYLGFLIVISVDVEIPKIWYSPVFVGLLIIAWARWIHYNQDNDD
jgi:hypothetical protein